VRDRIQYVSFFDGDYSVQSMKRASHGTAQNLAVSSCRSRC
jgi:hypothetical protein